jgi:acetyltransferase
MVEGVPFLQGCTPAFKAIGALIRYAGFQDRRRAALDAGGGGAGIALPPDTAGRARALVEAAAGRPLTEREGKQVLALYGIPTTREALATSVDEALAAARTIGYPVALKVEAPGILHKTEAGVVLLDVADEATLEHGFREVLARARAYDPGAEVRGVLVQEMINGGHEVILGMTRDPQFGPIVLLGLGGVFTEVHRDVSLRLPPLEAADVREMIDGLRAAPVLRGARGRPPADAEALADAVVRFSRLCLDVHDLVQEIDVNPLVVRGAGQGVTGVDCLIVPDPGGRPRD